MTDKSNDAKGRQSQGNHYPDKHQEANNQISPEQKQIYWSAAIGLQAVDGITVSTYMESLVEKEIKGELPYQALPELLEKYYDSQAPGALRTKEADFASLRIADIYRDFGFELSVQTLKDYHKHIFGDIYQDAGKFKDRNLYKAEPVLFGDTVVYSDYRNVGTSLMQLLSNESSQEWTDASKEYALTRIVRFTRDLWKIHPFSEGNTRTTAVFVGKYLATLGLEVTNALFKDNSLFFRNALVRASYVNISEAIPATLEYLTCFYDNLLFGNTHRLDNEDLFVATSSSDAAPPQQGARRQLPSA